MSGNGTGRKRHTRHTWSRRVEPAGRKRICVIERCPCGASRRETMDRGRFIAIQLNGARIGR